MDQINVNDVVALGVASAVCLTAIIGGTILLGLAIHRRTRTQELVYRERMAMIERGLVPPPETDPARFDQLTGRLEPAANGPGARSRTFGIVLISLGMALAMLISFAAGEPGVGFGVGGAVVVLGLGFLINSLLTVRRPDIFSPQPPRAAAPPSDRVPPAARES